MAEALHSLVFASGAIALYRGVSLGTAILAKTKNHTFIGNAALLIVLGLFSMGYLAARGFFLWL